MDVLITILIGIGIGTMVELLLPGHNVPELILAMLLGTAGSLLARYAGQFLGYFGTEEPEAFVAAGAGAIIILVAYGVLFRRRHSRR